MKSETEKTTCDVGIVIVKKIFQFMTAILKCG